MLLLFGRVGRFGLGNVAICATLARGTAVATVATCTATALAIFSKAFNAKNHQHNYDCGHNDGSYIRF